MTSQRLLVLQSLWAMERRQPDGFERSLDENLAMIQQAGFDGISTSCNDPGRVNLIARALNGSGLAVEGMCFPQTIDHLKSAIDLAKQINVLHLNVQPDIRPRRVSDCIPLLDGWIRVAEEAGMPIYFETHRNRMTTDLLFTLDLMDEVPGMRILADLSHILLGREFWYPISDEDEALVRQVLDRAWAFHGRVASREQIQVEITFPQHRIWLDLFLGWWKYGFRSWRKRAGTGACLSFTCELGPQPYAITDRQGKDTTDRWEEALLLRSLVRDLFDSVASEEQALPARGVAI
ncbi:MULTISPECIES: sugar phosphate isomerase/epimerase family protein [Bradyrhizobium]|uniref:Sugar phosphate isomerase/epimerase n=3 Tax=Bradyrhizobium TaxID=374 RepID=A0AAE5X8M1_9BRAD|nr:MULTISPECIES: TIM barrel protein [Bradyrhizobium]MCG2631971.1 TIM barrel protein [Bradyrhizobium zhengyangense]MCG2645026.1 TIM barrel protein [Bradyrhizobium zhengyangense]MCG2672764.1 TIM barrel protein [Bradyrhizobium zhengyangense]MDN4985385.1 TIM barrel protein [Bradyrhizobium sp. WYCCWR 13022]MDN5002384.1 TIM barrel protein [Bradyrhizobium sp. WYCCWR 12677]